MDCPKCAKSALAARAMKGSNQVLSYCEQCKGVWFRQGQLEKVLPGAIKELTIPPDAVLGKRRCPECSRSMHEFSYPQTFVRADMCSFCKGLWLDPGEAREISIVRKGLKKEAKEYDEVAGTKGQIIRLVNAALDWALHSY